MKIKIIELLNKIANGEEVPIEIEFKGTKYIFNKYCNQYYEKGKGSCFKDKLTFERTMEWEFYGDYLNSEVEIIEEDKSIEELETEMAGEQIRLIGTNETRYTVRVIDGILINKINELVKEINKLKEG